MEPIAHSIRHLCPGARPALATRLRWRRVLRGPLFVTTLLGIGLIGTACGSASPGVASLGNSATTTTSPAAASNSNGASAYQDAVKYATCMRSHGVDNFPDPTSSGLFINKRGLLNGQSVDTNSAQYASAQKTCQHLLANGGQITPVQQQEALAQALKFVQCLRTHGVPNMPDPSTAGGGVSIHPPVDPNSPQYQDAVQACRSLEPGGGGA